MSKNVVVISTSLRINSNSEQLAQHFAKGALDAKNDVTLISLKNKQLHFCKGCLACQQTGRCTIKDDATDIMDVVSKADVIVWATPIYYYGMSGQMKTLIDRLNPLFSSDYQFTDIYFLASAADDGEHVFEKALIGLNGWLDCFDKATLKGMVLSGGVPNDGDISDTIKLKEAYTMGLQV